MSIVDSVLHKIFGTPHERKVKQLRPVIAKIHEARKALEALDDAALAAKSAEFREKLKNGATLDDIKVEAFAVCQEACDRRLGIFNIFKPEFNFDFSKLGELQQYTDAAKAELEAGDVAGVIVPEINRFGLIEDHTGFADAVHAVKALLVEYCDPSTLAVLKTPAEWAQWVQDRVYEL